MPMIPTVSITKFKILFSIIPDIKITYPKIFLVATSVNQL